MQLGAKLRELRNTRRSTLAEVSKVTGLSVSFLSDVERERTKPSLDTLEKLASYYQVSVNDLLEEVDFGASTSTPLHPPGFDEFLLLKLCPLRGRAGNADESPNKCQ